VTGGELIINHRISLLMESSAGGRAERGEEAPNECNFQDRRRHMATHERGIIIVINSINFATGH
jgi:hypothetical protein